MHPVTFDSGRLTSHLLRPLRDGVNSFLWRCGFYSPQPKMAVPQWWYVVHSCAWDKHLFCELTVKVSLSLSLSLCLSVSLVLALRLRIWWCCWFAARGGCRTDKALQLLHALALSPSQGSQVSIHRNVNLPPMDIFQKSLENVALNSTGKQATNE